MRRVAKVKGLTGLNPPLDFLGMGSRGQGGPCPSWEFFPPLYIYLSWSLGQEKESKVIKVTT